MANAPADLLETPLAALHRASGGKLVDFGGWAMPVNYGSQLEEHHQVRRAQGMFDVSHMTVVDVSGEQVKAFLRYLLANDVDKLKTLGKALYSALLTPEGGVMDDLIVYWMPWGYRLVVNCSTREKDLLWINQQARAFDVRVVERADLAMIAIQGPQARATVAQVLGDEQLLAIGVFSGQYLTGAQSDWFVARTGYTGEDGFEVMLPNADAPAFWTALQAAGVAPCGLGARDTLRLEAGMNLYGHEMDEQVSPWAANMGWTIALTPSDRQFIGRAALEAQQQAGTDTLVGVVMPSRGVLRAGYPVIIAGESRQGVITSGTFSPSLGYSIALARIPSTACNQAQVLIRNTLVPVTLVKPCFVRNGKPLL